MSSSDLDERRGEDAPEPRSSSQVASARQLARIVGTAVAGALTVVTLGLVLALWGLGLTGKISQSTSEVLDLVKLGFALVAGVGGTVGLVLAYQRHLIAVEAGQRERAKEAREDAKEAREEAKLFNERFGSAADQLASEQYAVKLAGVYAMATLADDWETGRQTCINVLCANLRRDYTRWSADAEPAELLAYHDNREFRHTIIAVITTRLRDPDSSWHQCSFDFRFAVFDGGDFRGAIFSGGTVDFSSAKFSDSIVDFGGAAFSGGTVAFTRATFSGGIVDISGATFSGGTVDFNGATFSGSTVAFGSASFSGGTVDFSRSTFSGGKVTFNFARFSGSTVAFRGANASGGDVIFRNATFSGGALDFSGAEASSGDVDFSGATFSGGVVDFSRVPNFAVRPRFDFGAGAAPAGVLLPPRPD